MTQVSGHDKGPSNGGMYILIGFEYLNRLISVLSTMKLFDCSESIRVYLKFFPSPSQSFLIT